MIGITLIGGRGGDVGCALTGGDVICISIHICVFEEGVFIFSGNLLLGVRVFCGGGEGVGGRDFAGGQHGEKRLKCFGLRVFLWDG